VTEDSVSLDERGQAPAAPWLARWAPLLLTVVVMTLIVVIRTVTWPETPTPGDAGIAEGFLIVVEQTPVGLVVSYGFELPDGSRIFDKLPVGEGAGEANAAYGWARQGAGSLILVAYDPADTSVSLPYLEYPYWGTGAWTLVVGSILFPVAIWVRQRMYPATALAS
jgi:hypothetical protein